MNTASPAPRFVPLRSKSLVTIASGRPLRDLRAFQATLTSGRLQAVSDRPVHFPVHAFLRGFQDHLTTWVVAAGHSRSASEMMRRRGRGKYEEAAVNPAEAFRITDMCCTPAERTRKGLRPDTAVECLLIGGASLAPARSPQPRTEPSTVHPSDGSPQWQLPGRVLVMCS